MAKEFFSGIILAISQVAEVLSKANERSVTIDPDTKAMQYYMDGEIVNCSMYPIIRDDVPADVNLTIAEGRQLVASCDFEIIGTVELEGRLDVI